MALSGAAPRLVRSARDRRDPLPGTAGFAGELDGELVRDVLGREVVYAEADDPTTWSRDPAALDAPSLVPAGHARPIDTAAADRDPTGDRRLWTLPDPDPVDDADLAVCAVREAIRTAADDVLPDDAPVAFSGGVDSAIVATGTDGPLYVAGFEGCHDVAAARSAAASLDRTVRVVALEHDDLRRAVPAVVRATGRSNAMDVAIALPLYLVAERVAADGHDRLALGQGADELFGGYEKVANAPGDPRVAADTVRDARRETVLALPAQLERDLLALRAAGVDPVAPLLHDRVVEAALRLPADLLVRGDRRKRALRLAADDLPDEVRCRDKKAVQYGTYVSRELDRLARRAGFKRRTDDHVTRYVESLCGGGSTS